MTQPAVSHQLRTLRDARLGMTAAGSRVELRAARVDLVATRQDKPPRITSVSYALRIDSPADDERLERNVDLAERNGTVLGSLRGGTFPIDGRWERLPSGGEERS